MCFLIKTKRDTNEGDHFTNANVPIIKLKKNATMTIRNKNIIYTKKHN